MPLEIVRNDITKMTVDAIVNAANTGLEEGGGVCGAIFAAAGADRMQAECNRIGKCAVGDAVVTSGGNLPVRYVIHTAGPVWNGGNSGEELLLRSCYANSLARALELGCESIAIPLISSGIYGYPKDLALSVAISTIGEFLKDHELMVYLTVYDRKALLLSERLFPAIAQFIDDNYVDERMYLSRERNASKKEDLSFLTSPEIPSRSVPPASVPMRKPKSARHEKMYRHKAQVMSIFEDYSIQPLNREPRSPEGGTTQPAKEAKRSLEDVMSRLEETFSQRLLRLIDEKGMTDVDAYKRANVDRKLFSKIRGAKDHNPSKGTAVAFAIALRLNLDETRDLLGTAGFTLSNSSKSDVIISYFIMEGNYNIHEINEAMFVFKQPLLGACG
jgi:O-acetyl-ADP-ribose deacetylase (regulator of RNase III)